MYIPSSKISKKTTKDNESFVYKKNKNPYKGPYIETTEGRYYAGHNNNKVGPEIVKQQSTDFDQRSRGKLFGVGRGIKTFNIIKKDIKEQIENTMSPSTSKPIPTNEDYKNGFFIRYFLKRINGEFYIEINKTTFNSISKMKPEYDYNLYEIGNIQWNITGPDLQKRNASNIKMVEKKHPNISILFPILNEYQRATPIIQEDLVTHGGELYYESGNEYIGRYHIHPIKGPMEGPKHTSTPHANLYYFKQLPQLSNNTSYNDFVKNYDKINCYRCIQVNKKNQIVSRKASQYSGCPKGTYPSYEEAAEACPEKIKSSPRPSETDDGLSNYRPNSPEIEGSSSETGGSY